jgi:hypothetical protein
MSTKSLAGSPFGSFICLHNYDGKPLTISMTTTIMHSRSALLKQLVLFRNASEGSLVRYGNADGSSYTSSGYAPTLLKRWKAEAKDLLTAPAHGVWTRAFPGSAWAGVFEAGSSYEVTMKEDPSIMYWKSGTIEDLVSEGGLLGPD